MEWIERSSLQDPPPARPGLPLLEKAIELRPNPGLYVQLGHARAQIGDAAGAVAAFAEAERLDPAGFTAWPVLAEALIALREPEAVIAAVDRGLDAGASDTLRHFRGLALRQLGRRDEMIAEFERALAAGTGQFNTLRILLRHLARRNDGAALLDQLDRLPRAYRGTAGARAYRAIAFSQLGRAEEARALVDVERHVLRVPFEPPAEFGGIEAFNRMLADEILRDPPPAATRDGFEINYAPRGIASAAFAALSEFTRARIEDYAANRAAIGATDALPPLPERGSTERATVVLRRDGTNGEHIHASNYLSTVYYVQVPKSVREAQDDRGALVLGCCGENANGHQAVWGTRRIKPVAGMLTLFPSHVFHDVVPSRAEEPRIVVTADLQPESDD